MFICLCNLQFCQTFRERFLCFHCHWVLSPNVRCTIIYNYCLLSKTDCYFQRNVSSAVVSHMLTHWWLGYCGILNLHISCSFQQGLHTLNHPHLWIQTCYSVCIYITLTHIDVQTWSHLALGYLPLAHKHFSNVSRDKISLIKHSFSYGSMPISSCVIRSITFYPLRRRDVENAHFQHVIWSHVIL